MTDVPPLLIRPLGPEDARAYRTLRRLALEAAPTAFSSSLEDEAHLTDAEIRARAAPEAPGVTFGAFAGDILVGMAGYVPERRVKTRHKATMVGVFLLPQWCGNGAGRRLTEAVVAHARAQRAILHCTVQVGNLAARNLYRSLGFETYGVEPAAICFNGEFFDNELLVLDLRAG